MKYYIDKLVYNLKIIYWTDLANLGLWDLGDLTKSPVLFLNQSPMIAPK